MHSKVIMTHKFPKFSNYLTSHTPVGRAGAVGIATCYGLDGDRIPVGARFSASVQTVPRAHHSPLRRVPALSPGVDRPGRGVNYPPHLAPKLNKDVPLLPV